MLNPALQADMSRLSDLSKAYKPYQEWTVIVPQMNPCVSQQLLATDILISKNFAT